MAAIVKFIRPQQLKRLQPLFAAQSVRNHWNKDWKPGPYPQNAEEREAAAKKYGLLPSEYQPYPDDGMGHGDYPYLPPNSTESRDLHYPYDLPELKRNFGDVMNAEADMYGEDRIDASHTPHPSGKVQWAMFLGVFLGFTGIFYFLENYKMFQPALPKSYPADGKKHYTF
ncbi:NADH dehydrogenase [ubiquinone] 1 beta subcomplex subunit 8, mitochondrial [Ischnura elegans]|uniref:NADH dehydrogenase [ubiquinone] 1 beta subcomplex subunit 8, mitochondrial n=1 Tax=Ischnura elegans TaxID=197161 RepID=UPI001ED8846A|nr:NADH dehydrogenase [ubiquinone] 1 beta subcomplex subunit 8, mitochondrial [Ischnura elegans]